MTYNHIASQASQILVLTGYIYVAQLYIIHYETCHVLFHDIGVRAQRTSTVCKNTKLLCKKVKINLLRKKVSFNFFENSHCAHAMVTTIRLTIWALPYRLRVAHVTLASMLFFLPARTDSSLPSRATLSEYCPHLFHCFPD